MCFFYHNFFDVLAFPFAWKNELNQQQQEQRINKNKAQTKQEKG